MWPFGQYWLFDAVWGNDHIMFLEVKTIGKPVLLGKGRGANVS